MLDKACAAIASADSELFEECLAGIERQLARKPPVGVVHRRAFLASCHAAIRQAWMRGWQPADVVRVVGRRLGAPHVRMVIDLIAAQHSEYATATVAESWEAQLTAVGATVWWSADSEYFTSFAERELIDPNLSYRYALEVLHSLRSLPRLEVLVPLPGSARRGSLAPNMVSGVPVDTRMRDKIRGLLSKAESTEYPEEAESLTVKAQELMARYSIDYVLLAASTGSPADPVGVRIGIDNPYEDPKATLLQRVADANGCQAAFAKPFGFSTVVGFARDVEAVEVLFTSLLVQATAAMIAAGSRTDAMGRSRTRSVRQSFLHPYSVRIGQRLRGAADMVGRDMNTETGGALVPVLAARDEAVRRAADTMIGGTVQRSFHVSNREGWILGTVAADRANVNVRRGLEAS